MFVQKAKSAQSNTAVYVLTEKGQALEPVIISMARWGLRYLREDTENQISRPDLLVVAFRAAFNPGLAKEIHEAYEFRIDETIFYVEVDNGKIVSGLGPARHPAFVYSTDAETFDAIVNGSLDPAEAEQRGVLDVIGDREAYHRCLQMFRA